jgi:hypothetical protein
VTAGDVVGAAARGRNPRGTAGAGRGATGGSKPGGISGAGRRGAGVGTYSGEVDLNGGNRGARLTKKI